MTDDMRTPFQLHMDELMPPALIWNDDAQMRFDALCQRLKEAEGMPGFSSGAYEYLIGCVVNAELAGLNRLQEVSELHAGQIEGWKGEVEQLEKLAKDRWAKIEALEEKVATARNSARQDAQTIEELRKQYDELLDEHARMHIHAGRQEGFIDAIRELRPQPKRRKNKALDLVEATMAAMPKRMHVDAGLVAEGYGSKQERLAPWYRRRHV